MLLIGLFFVLSKQICFSFCWFPRLLVGWFAVLSSFIVVCMFEAGIYYIVQDVLELVILRWYLYRNTGKIWGFEKGKEALTSESD